MIYINGQHIRSFTKDNRIYYAMRDIGKAYGFHKVSDIYKTISSLEKTQVRIVHANGGNAFANVVTAKGMLEYLTITNPTLVPSFRDATRDFERHSEPVATPPTYLNTKPVTRQEGLYQVVTFEGASIRCLEDTHSVMVSILDVCDAIGLGYYNQQNKLATKPWSRKLFAWKPEYENGQGSLALVDVKILSRWLQGIKRHKSSKDVLERLDHYKICLEPFIRDALASEDYPLTQSMPELERAETTTPEPVSVSFSESTDMNILGFDFDGHPVRVSMKNSEPRFVLNDVCEALNLRNPSQVGDRLDEDEKDTIHIMDSIGRPRNTTVINESGLYSVILTSRKPNAKRFKKWVTSELLPTLRKTGSYSLTETSSLPKMNVPENPLEQLDIFETNTGLKSFVTAGLNTLAKNMIAVRDWVVSEFDSVRAETQMIRSEMVSKSELSELISGAVEDALLKSRDKEQTSLLTTKETLPVSYDVVEEVLKNDSLETTLNNAIAKRLGIEGLSSTEMRKNFQEVSQAAAIEYGKQRDWDLKKIYMEHSRGYLKAISNHKGKWTPEVYLKAMNRLLEIFPVHP